MEMKFSYKLMKLRRSRLGSGASLTRRLRHSRFNGVFRICVPLFLRIYPWPAACFILGSPPNSVFWFNPLDHRLKDQRHKKMVASQRMKVANEKASKTVTMRGNVPKSSVSFVFWWMPAVYILLLRNVLLMIHQFNYYTGKVNLLWLMLIWQAFGSLIPWWPCCGCPWPPEHLLAA